MSSAPIVVCWPSLSGGRRVTVHSHGQDEILGTAYSDHDLVVFLEGAGVADPEVILDAPSGWSGAAARPTSSAPPDVRHAAALCPEFKTI
ncbi:hypothetical protein ACIF8T_34730 [Streptomyces sp. NPDC085946]|uniref:hypothetical protein n=1 Tax=Streptomyces sp. NPDC085946 TaxID=3365744 RepID=UPI0037D00C19